MRSAVQRQADPHRRPVIGGQQQAVAAEVVEAEPPAPDRTLLARGDVTLTPHIAGASLQTIRCAAAMVAEELRRHLAGEAPLNPC